jgi:hypothetical protein
LARLWQVDLYMTARPLILPVVALCSKSASSGQLSEEANPGFGD